MLGLPEAQSACLATEPSEPSLRDQGWDFDGKIMPLIMSFIEFEVSMSVFFSKSARYLDSNPVFQRERPSPKMLLSFFFLRKIMAFFLV